MKTKHLGSIPYVSRSYLISSPFFLLLLLISSPSPNGSLRSTPVLPAFTKSLAGPLPLAMCAKPARAVHQCHLPGEVDIRPWHAEWPPHCHLRRLAERSPAADAGVITLDFYFFGGHYS